MKKAVPLSGRLVAIKGTAAPANDMPARGVPGEPEVGLQPLNFRVGATFRRDFKTYAAAHDLKLNELLRRSFAAYRAAQGD